MNTDEPISTKDRLGVYDAIETAKPGEPLFPIQGGDPFGPDTVLHWAKLAREAGLAEEDEKLAEHLLTKASGAERVAWRMQEYQRGVHVESAAETSPAAPSRPTYGGWVDTADEETKALRRQREGRIQSAGKLHNAIALSTDAFETLARLQVCPEAEVKVREAVELIREAARQIEPRRGNERT